LSDFAESYGDSFEEDTDCEVDDSEVGVEVGEDFAVEEVDEVLISGGSDGVSSGVCRIRRLLVGGIISSEGL
jgi:hypothetical protein